ncbi:CPBP family intramembrane glutamic endopeptidase [Phormidium sp. FACHB-1136]|uniref:CPBP family intramembrane glutamic endopeptidase n=1 Tax=Phormidium sp. FACHB-1136 TaxID=2692848 RepID=UPI00168906D9|nr:CPBP family intramembrane glutamic endopeptidase [Phormidium sp. FACHB-1136]MBD2427018.1 CPBP family intramembrane metalloprotease [Phormidium sp. FACHB-1136]
MDRFNQSSPNPFRALKARWVLAGFVVISAILGLGLILLGSLHLLPLEVGDPILAPTLYILVFTGLCLMIVVQGRSPALDLRDLLGPLPRRLAWLQLLWLVVGLFLFSLGAFQVSYLGLSWVAPHLVESTLQQSLLLSADNAAAPRLYNSLMLFAVVVVAPVAEEFIFRGILLHRWGLKWGVRTAMVMTSVLFGLLHSNLIGLFMFGVVMTLLYLTTRSLLVPMVAHALNNALASGLEYATQIRALTPIHTLADFRASWWLGVVCLLVSAPWVLRYVVYHWPTQTTPLPYFVNQSQRLDLGSRP